MLIPESMSIVFLLGFVFGGLVTLFTLFLVGLLYRQDCAHLCSDEVGFEDEKYRPHWPVSARLENTRLHPTPARQSH